MQYKELEKRCFKLKSVLDTPNLLLNDHYVIANTESLK